MSIATELQNYNDGLLAAYAKVSEKGGTVPAHKNLGNLPNAIDSIPVGGDEPGGDAVITSYARGTGVIEGTGFGSTAGTVYMLDRDTHTYVSQPASSWSSTSIRLTTPLDLEHLEGNTSIVVVKSDGTWSTKLVVYGDVEVEGTGKLYYRKDDGTVGTITATMDDLNQKTNNGWKRNINGVTIYNTDVLGFQFGKTATPPSNGFSSAFGWCVNLNQPIVIPATFTYLQSMFNNCYSFNQPVILPSNLTLLGNANSMFDNCYNFNQPIKIPSGVTEIRNDFLKNCGQFNQKIELPSGLTKIGNYFLYGCTKFNQPLEFPSTLTAIGDYFLASTTSFNQELVLPSNITTIWTHFLEACGTEKSVTLPANATSIGSYFMAYMTRYNHPITIPSGVTTMGDYCFQGMKNFNSEITLPQGLTTIGSYFLATSYGYYKPLTIPSSVTSIGTYFMNNTYGALELTVNTNSSPTDNYSLGMQSNNCRAYDHGITLKGTGVASWIANLPNRTSNPYRKLIDGTA